MCISLSRGPRNTALESQAPIHLRFVSNYSRYWAHLNVLINSIKNIMYPGFFNNDIKVYYL